MLTISFGLLKLQAMLDRKNPQIAINKIELEAGESYSLAADNFMIAFSAETR